LTGSSVCTLLVYRNPLPGVFLAVAANRDELWERPPGAFTCLQEDPQVVGGLDREAAGAWLAASAAGFVVAVTNARLGARRRPGQRSRGLLARDLALARDAESARSLLVGEDLERYAPVNLLLATGERYIVATNVPRPRIKIVKESAVGLGNRPAFDEDRRVADLLRMGAPRGSAETYLGRLQALLARHEEPAACHHLADGGTVSSTVMLLRWPFEESTIVHADGPPCNTPYTA